MMIVTTKIVKTLWQITTVLLPSTSSSPTPSISPAVKWSKIYSIFPHKLLKLHAALKDNAPNCPFNHVFVFLIFRFLFSWSFVFCCPHFLFFVFLIFCFLFSSFLFFVVLIFCFLFSSFFLTCSSSTPLAHILEVRLLVHARSSWSEKKGFICSLFLLYDIIVKSEC